MDGRGTVVRLPVGARYFSLLQIFLKAQGPSDAMDNSGWSVKLITRLNLVPRLQMNYLIYLNCVGLNWVQT